MKKIYTYLLFLCCSCLAAFSAQAQTPQYFKGVGTGSNSYPFSSTLGLKTQHFYLPGDLPGAVSGTITRLYFRSVTPNASASFTEFYLKLGQTTATQFPGGGTTFATGLTTVVYGATYTVNSATGATDWFYIDLQTPFVFDATQSLILEVVWNTKTSGGFNVRTSSGPSAPNNKRLTSASPMATTGSASGNWMDLGIELGNPLNVKIKEWVGTSSGQDAELSWITTEEHNISSYEVERSFNGSEFKSVATVTGKGSESAQENRYFHKDGGVFSDGNPTAFYRLKIVLSSGAVEYSKVVMVSYEDIAPGIMNIYPNPFTSDIFVSLYSAAAGAASITISDMKGSLVYEQSIGLNRGRSAYTLPGAERLAPGTYVLAIMVNGQKTVRQIVKK